MPEFNVLKCFECNMFQVDIVKKAKKWTCKICNHKQSVKKIYFTSSAAKECREKAQEININLQEAKATANDALLDHLEEDEVQNQCHEFQAYQEALEDTEVPKPTASRWSKFTCSESNESSNQSFKRNIESNSSFQNSSRAQIEHSMKQQSGIQNSHYNPSYSSLFHQKKLSTLPKIIGMHKKPLNNSKLPDESSHIEPPQKKIKSIDEILDDDDFTISQKDLDANDQLS